MVSGGTAMMGTFRVILWNESSFDEVELHYVLIAYANKHVHKGNADEQIVMVRAYPEAEYEKVAMKAYEQAKEDVISRGLSYEDFKTECLKEISLADTDSPYYLYDVNGNRLSPLIYDLATLRPWGDEDKTDKSEKPRLPVKPYAGFYTKGHGTWLAPKTGTYVESMWNIVVINHNFMSNLIGEIASNVVGCILFFYGMFLFFKMNRGANKLSIFANAFLVLLMLFLPLGVSGNGFDFYNHYNKFAGWFGIITMCLAFIIFLVLCGANGMRGFFKGILAIIVIFFGASFSSLWMSYLAYGIMIILFIVSFFYNGGGNNDVYYIEYQGDRVYGYYIDNNTFRGNDSRTYQRVCGDIWERT